MPPDSLNYPLRAKLPQLTVIALDHRWQTQGRGSNLALRLVFSSPAPCFYPAVLSSFPLVKEQLHLYSPKNYIRPFEGNLEADVAPSENEFNTPALDPSLGTATLPCPWRSCADRQHFFLLVQVPPLACDSFTERYRMENGEEDINFKKFYYFKYSKCVL